MAARSSDDTDNGRLATLAVLALVVGAAAGLIGAVFRIVLEQADALRDRVIVWAHGEALWGFAAVVLAGGAAALVATWLVRRFAPHASGSGIPHVEMVLRREAPLAPYILLPVKFVGGVLAIGSGMALGREGPSVQMGASIAQFVGTVCRCSWPDCRVLMAAGAGAGLATAFNSPIAGAVFVLEELVQRFEHRMAIAALAASATAIAVARALLGDAPDFSVEPLAHIPPLGQPLFLVLGVIAGLLAFGYNRLLLGSIALVARFDRVPAEWKAAVIGAAVAVVAWFAPGLVGGGDPITQRTLSGAVVLAFLPVAFLIRALLGSASYAAGTPGGLFAPMLVLGAQLGLLCGAWQAALFPSLAIPPQAFAVVGMAAFFTGVVRAPMTGIVLIIEMTAAFNMLLPMLIACFAAMLVPTLLGDTPIYEALRDRASPKKR